MMLDVMRCGLNTCSYQKPRSRAFVSRLEKAILVLSGAKSFGSLWEKLRSCGYDQQDINQYQCSNKAEFINSGYNITDGSYVNSLVLTSTLPSRS